jgi:hypothetical protein
MRFTTKTRRHEEGNKEELRLDDRRDVAGSRIATADYALLLVSFSFAFLRDLRDPSWCEFQV